MGSAALAQNAGSLWEGSAIAWIESHQGLEKHPKTIRLMAAMSWDLDVTLGKLHRFWWWCVDCAPDGDLRKYSNDVMAAAVGLPFSVGMRFVEAMVDAGGRGEDGNVLPGFLERKPYFRIHEWWEYFGPFLQVKFKKNPEKWRRIRSLYAEPSPNQADNGGGNGSNNGGGNGGGNGGKGEPLAPSPQTPLPNQDLNLNLPLHDSGSEAFESAVVEIPTKAQTPQARLVELFKVGYEKALPGQTFKDDRSHYVIASKLIERFGLPAVIDKARTLYIACNKKNRFFTVEDGFAAFTPNTLSTHWNRLVATAGKKTPEDETREELKRQEDLRERINRAAR